MKLTATLAIVAIFCLGCVVQAVPTTVAPATHSDVLDHNEGNDKIEDGDISDITDADAIGDGVDDDKDVVQMGAIVGSLNGIGENDNDVLQDSDDGDIGEIQGSEVVDNLVDEDVDNVITR